MTAVIEGERRAFLTGNEVVAWAALAAGAEVMFGYPITPQNEIMHYWARLAPRYGRKFLQTEDELSAGYATIGAVLGGVKAFTATAGPGHVLMQEALAMAEMMRLPVVAIITQRGGPSTATVIYSQQEVNLACFGGNGEGFRLVYSVAGLQDLYEYTLKAFGMAWRYRLPTIVLGDGYQAKMRGPVKLFDPARQGIDTGMAAPLLGAAGTPGRERPPVHLRNTYNLEEELLAVVEEQARSFEQVAEQVADYEEEKR
ncbi:MAG: ferredoxin oxidoreductase, partial [Clostridia bacterium]|nr:ferredoxin oxidoreductase [Clostridia bacterium]